MLRGRRRPLRLEIVVFNVEVHFFSRLYYSNNTRVELKTNIIANLFRKIRYYISIWVL